MVKMSFFLCVPSEGSLLVWWIWFSAQWYNLNRWWDISHETGVFLSFIPEQAIDAIDNLFSLQIRDYTAFLIIERTNTAS